MAVEVSHLFPLGCIKSVEALHYFSPPFDLNGSTLSHGTLLADGGQRGAECFSSCQQKKILLQNSLFLAMIQAQQKMIKKKKSKINKNERNRGTNREAGGWNQFESVKFPQVG